MNSQGGTSLMRRLLFGCLLLLSVTLAPGAAGQSVSLNFQITNATALLPAGGEGQPMEVTATVEMPNNFVWPVARAEGEWIRVGIETACDGGLTITGPAEILIPVDVLATGSASRASATATYEAGAATTSPGLTMQKCEITGTIPDSSTNSAVYSGVTVHQALALSAGYRAILTPAGEATQGNVGSVTTVNIPIRCDCNAETFLDAQVIDPEIGASVTVESSPLEPFVDGAQIVQLSFSGMAGKEVQVRLTPSANVDPTQAGESVELAVKVPGGGGMFAPAPVAPLVFVLLMGLAIAGRRGQ